MSTPVVTVPDSVDPRKAFEMLDAEHRRLAAVVDATGRLVGILTRTAALRATLYQPAIDESGRLRVAGGDRLSTGMSPVRPASSSTPASIC